MGYRHRNLLYLRISSHVILPLYLYLDDRHTSWMTDQILQRVVADLRPLILQKWRDEEQYKDVTSGAKAKKFGIVDVHRGESYQVAYFLQKNEAHDLLVKYRYYSTLPKTNNPPHLTSKDTSPLPSKPNKKAWPPSRKRKRSEQLNATADEDTDPTSPNEIQRKTSSLQKDTDILSGAIEMDTDDTEDEEINPGVAKQVDDMDDPDLDEPKPQLNLRYVGYGVPNVCLALIVEPFGESAKTITGASQFSRFVGANPATRERSETPFNSDGPSRLVTPADFEDLPEMSDLARPSVGTRPLPPVPLFHADTPAPQADGSDDEETSFIMQFSQAVNMGAYGSGAGMGNEEADDDDADALFGDADEGR